MHQWKHLAGRKISCFPPPALLFKFQKSFQGFSNLPTYFNPSTCKVPETQKWRYAYSKSPGKTFDIWTSTTRRKIVGAKFSSTNQVKKDIYVLWQWRMKKNNLFVCFAPSLFKTGFFFSDLGSFSCNKLDYAFSLLLRVGPQVNSVMKWKCTFH